MSCENSRNEDHWSSFRPLIEGVASKNFNNDSTCGCGGGRTVISSACEVWRGELIWSLVAQIVATKVAWLL
jgi:hypothetical protein